MERTHAGLDLASLAAVIAGLLLSGCRTTSEATDVRPLHQMGEFQVAAGDTFLEAIKGHDPVVSVSIIDCYRAGDYQVNRRWVFGDTMQQEAPGRKSYSTLAQELGMEPDELLAVLRAFDALKVNEYRRMEGYRYLQVAVGFTQASGYVHLDGPLEAPDGLLPYSDRHLRLVRELGGGWYEVEGAP